MRAAIDNGALCYPILLVLQLGCVPDPPRHSPGVTSPHRAALVSLSDADISSEQLLAASAPVRLFAESTQPAAAYGGGVHLVAWKSGPYYAPFAVRIRGSDGSPVDPVRIALAGPYGPCGPMNARPAVAYASSYFLVAWSALDRVCAVRFPATGDVGTLTPIVLSETGLVEPPTVASDGNNFLMVWAAWRTGSGDSVDSRRLYRARIRAADGAVLDPGGVRLIANATDQRHPEVDFDGTNFLVMWRDRRVPAGLYAARINTLEGQSLDGDGFLVHATALDNAQSSLAYDGSNHLAVSSDNSRIVGVRIRASNRIVLDPSPVTLATLGAAHHNAGPSRMTVAISSCSGVNGCRSPRRVCELVESPGR